MDVSSVSQWLVLLGMALGGGLWLGALSADVKNIKEKNDKEPSAAQMAALSTKIDNLQNALDKVETNIDRLFERTNKQQRQ